MPFKNIVVWYKKYDRPLSALSLVGGFVFDALTLRRVDTFWENFWIIVHLVVVAVAILILNRRKEGEKATPEFDFWLINLLQFTYGGLLSTFLVFYFRSATLSVSWPFLLLLALIFFINERFKHHYERLTFQVSLLFLSTFLFMIFAVPVVLGTLGTWVFILSGVLSLLLLRLFVSLLAKFSKEKFLASRTALRFSVLSVFALVNVLYFTNIIPPLPISLSEGGIYRSVRKDIHGDYIFDSGPQSWSDYLTLYPTIHTNNPSGTSLYAYTAIFSPASFSTSIIHVWELYNESEGRWVEMSRVTLPVNGGREEGYRTFSIASVTPGRWRVSVLTSTGQVIGRLNFKVVL